MLFLQRTVLVIFILFGLFAGGAYLLPREIEVRVTYEIDAPPEEVYAYIGDLRKWEDWSSWAQPIASRSLVVTGDPGIGQTLTWTAADAETVPGAIEVTGEEAPRSISHGFSFGGGIEPARSTITVEPKGNGTFVTWVFVGDMGYSPVRRWGGWLRMEKEVGTQNERSLRRLDEIFNPPEPEEQDPLPGFTPRVDTD